MGNAANQGDNRSGGASNSLTAKNPRSGATNKPNVKGVEQSHKSGSGSSLKNIRRQSTAESQAIQNSQPYQTQTTKAGRGNQQLNKKGPQQNSSSLSIGQVFVQKGLKAANQDTNSMGESQMNPGQFA